jgi:predicted HTH transcriptional regulator
MQLDVNASLLQLIEKGEVENLEFKFEINDSRKIAETICAFANTSGGDILVGVKDNGSIAGIRSSEEYFMIEGAAQLYVRPEVKFTSKLYSINKKEVLLVHIDEAEKKPVFCINRDQQKIAYQRVADANFQADPVTVQMWRKIYNIKKPSLYTANEEKILHLLDETPDAHLSRISNKSKIPYKQTIETLAQLVVWDLIEIEHKHGKSFYKLKS